MNGRSSRQLLDHLMSVVENGQKLLHFEAFEECACERERWKREAGRVGVVGRHLTIFNETLD